MNTLRKLAVVLVPVTAWLASGCAEPTVDFSKIERPARAAELEAYDVFVGEWMWRAEMTNAEEADKKWVGTAKWEWTLDKRCLCGTISAESTNAKFNAEGVWSWHPKSKKYIWWMFNNWGYPQQGTARYDADAKRWCMNYTSVGLDGTTSYGLYRMKVIDDNKLEWTMQEWVDMMHLFPKMEMEGTYKRLR